MGKELSSFFTAQGEVEAAAKEAEAIRKDPKRNKEKSATSIAMDCVLRAEELRIAERELRDMFAIQGKLDMYKRMCQIRADIIESRQREIKEENRAAQAKIKKRRLHQFSQRLLSFYFHSCRHLPHLYRLRLFSGCDGYLHARNSLFLQTRFSRTV
jgi:hypothetical protein